MSYETFLKSKVALAQSSGFEPLSPAHPSLFPHQRDICEWGIRKGRAGLMMAFGLGKSRIQLQLMKWIHEQTGGKTLIIAPLGVKQEFTAQDGPAMGMTVKYCRNMAEVDAAGTPYIITNYERVVKGQMRYRPEGGMPVWFFWVGLPKI